MSKRKRHSSSGRSEWDNETAISDLAVGDDDLMLADSGTSDEYLQKLLADSGTSDEYLQKLLADSAISDEYLQKLLADSAISDEYLQKLLADSAINDEDLQKLLADMATSDEDLQDSASGSAEPPPREGAPLHASATALDVAKWMAHEVHTRGRLSHSNAKWRIRAMFGARFLYKNANGNDAISREILAGFLLLTCKTVVWERKGRLWRLRRPADPPGVRAVE